MSAYINRLNSLIVKCAEYSTNRIAVSFLNGEWDKFVKAVNDFMEYYQLTGTGEYQSLNYDISQRNTGIMGETPAQKLLKHLLDFRKFENTVPNYFDRVFISHSSTDIPIVKPFVNLLEKIGLTKKNLFCSSVEGYRIPIGENIYDYLKREFTHKNTLVIMMLSDNYYNSKPSLNEMGATWVMSKEYLTILLRGFEFSQIEGSIDPQKIGFKINEVDRLDEFKNKLIAGLRLQNAGQNWVANRDAFLKEIHDK